MQELKIPLNTPVAKQLTLAFWKWLAQHEKHMVGKLQQAENNPTTNRT